MSNPKTEACSNCLYCIALDASQGGQQHECRRYPPTVMKDPESRKVISVFPKVKLHFWCGDHQFR